MAGINLPAFTVRYNLSISDDYLLVDAMTDD